MLTHILSLGGEQPHVPKEGDLYKEVTVHGKTFRLVYGYYEEFERDGRYNEPMPIYPDFIKEPTFTEEGIPIVTAMQDICGQYDGEAEGDSCSQCRHFHKCEELFGVCRCLQKQKAGA